MNTKTGKRIGQIRKSKNISQEELAFETHMDRTYISRIETGVANPTLRMLNKIARRLGVTLIELLKEED